MASIEAIDARQILDSGGTRPSRSKWHWTTGPSGGRKCWVSAWPSPGPLRTVAACSRTRAEASGRQQRVDVGHCLIEPLTLLAGLRCAQQVVRMFIPGLVHLELGEFLAPVPIPVPLPSPPWRGDGSARRAARPWWGSAGPTLAAFPEQDGVVPVRYLRFSHLPSPSRIFRHGGVLP